MQVLFLPLYSLIKCSRSGVLSRGKDNIEGDANAGWRLKFDLMTYLSRKHALARFTWKRGVFALCAIIPR